MKKSQKQAVAVGAGVAALAAAATAAYLLTGKNAKNRKKVAKWAKDMESDVVRQLKKARSDSRATYNQVVDEVARSYKKLKKVDPGELAAVAGQLKSHWDAIRSELERATKTVRKARPKRHAKKATKKRS